MADDIVVETVTTVQVVETSTPTPLTIDNVAGTAAVIETENPVAQELVNTTGASQVVETNPPTEIEIEMAAPDSIVVEATTGPTGSTPVVYSGTAPPNPVTGTIGDLYIVNSGATIGDLYQKTKTGWNSPLVNLRGGIASVNGISGTNIILAANDINTGSLPIAQVPTGTSAVTVALGNHLHTGVYEPVITGGTTAQYWRGDKSWQTLNKAAVGLGNVDNTSDASKPISTLTQAALDLKGDLSLVNLKAPIASPTFTGTVSGITKAMVGLGNVDNTTDLGKPISTLTQTALNGKEPSITGGTTGQYWRGDKSFQTLDNTAVGLGNVTNVDTTNASNISSGTLAIARIPTGTTSTTVALGNHDHNTVYVGLTGAQTIAGAKVFSNRAEFNAGGDSLALKPGSADYTFMTFFARTASPTTRSGYIGYGLAATLAMTIANEVANGDIVIQTAGTSKITLTTPNVAVGTLLSTPALRLGTSTTAGFVLTADISGNATWQAAADLIPLGTTAQYYRGDKSWQTLNPAAVGLGNVANVVQVDLTSGQTITGAKVMNNASNTFTGIGTALTALNASNLGSGTVPQARIIPNSQRFIFTTGSEARPTGATYVEWIGPVSPVNASNDDTWTNTAVPTIENPVVSMPIGTIQMYAASGAPTNWLACNGAAVSRTTYATLFALIGTTFGTGDGSTTFNLPNLQGRFPLMINGSHALATTGGAETHTLTIAEMPAHDHDVMPVHTNARTGDTVATTPSGSFYGMRYTAALMTQGGGGAHNNMPPFISINYIIKVL